MDTTLKIDTILGQQQDAHDRGPLLLAAVQGIEGISMPFAYDVTMYRHMEDGDIDPTKMISTPVTIGMRGKTNEYTYRSGVFQTFQKAGTNEQNWEKGFQTDFRVFNARIVPAFKMLDYEIRYRVFEDKTVLEIIQEVMEGFPKLINFQSYVSTGLLKSDDYKKIPYCVQFGETSLNFLSRLMAEFDIWYVFDHRQSDIKSSNETMVLGSSFALFQQCTRMDMDVVFSAPDTDEIGGFQRSFVPARKRVWVSDFNMLNPAHVPRGSATTTGLYDMLPRETDPTSFEREIFPALLTDPSDSDDAMSEQAKSRVEDEEDGVFTVQGQCKNPSFMAGRIFHIRNDKTEPNLGNTGVPAGNNYLITQMSFAAFENAYGHYFYQDVGNWLLSPLRWVWSLFRKESLQQALYLDATAALASGGLSNWVQNQNITHTTPSPGPYINPDNPYEMNFGDTFFAGMNTSFVQALLQLYLVNAPKEILARHDDKYSNAFFAIPWDANKYSLIPGPDAVKPRAYGPHLAIVVGPDGNKDVALGGGTDIYADGLGRVRVRFPWQRVVPLPKGLAPAPDQDLTDPLQSDRRTCWVSVSEGWAGHGFGTQFLPRIGQEVIVSFLDGDPERPIVTGRRYNADRGFPNLPFTEGQGNPKSYDINNWNDPDPSSNFRFNGLKTSSTPQGKDDKSRYHLMRFDDTYNCEQLLLRSQGRLDVTAFAHSFETTYGNKNVRVAQGKDSKGKPFGGNMYTTVDGEYDLHVGGNRFEQVDKDYEITVKGDVRADIKGNLTAVIKGDMSLGVNSLTVEATEKISFKVGQSFITIDHCAVYIKGACLIYENCGGSAPSAASVTMQNIADATLAEPGDQWNTRLTDCNVHGAPGGKRGTHKDSPTPAPACDMVAGGVCCNFLSSPPPQPAPADAGAPNASSSSSPANPTLSC